MAPPLTDEQVAVLKRLYYDKKFMFGRDRLWHYLREHGHSDISRRQVMEWLSKQMVHQMFAPARTPRDIQPTVATKPFGQVGIDLMDMSTSADKGFKWILTGIDLFTKKAYAVALKDKTEATVVTGMKQLLDSMTQAPKVVRSDNGSEFIAAGFKELLKERGIKQVLSAAGKPQSNGQIERFNGILKRLINMSYLSTGRSNWVSELPSFLRNYNATWQRVIGMSPDAAEAGAEGVKERIAKEVKKRHPLDNDKQRFEQGDTVRLRIQNAPNEKKGEAWSRDTFLVVNALAPRVEHRSWQYELLGKDGRYYNNDLLAVPAVEEPVQLPETYIISKLVRPSVQAGKRGYVVRWKGYKEADDTWEPRDDLMQDVPKMVEKYERDNKVVWKQAVATKKWSFTATN